MMYENATGYGDVFTIANTVSGGVLAYTIPVTLWCALFLATIPFGRDRALTFSSFITTLSILVLNKMGMIDYWLFIPAVLILALGLFMLQQKKNESGGG